MTLRTLTKVGEGAWLSTPKLATSDVTTPAPRATKKAVADLKAAALAPMGTDALGDPPTPKRRPMRNVTPKPDKVAAARVPADRVLALLDELRISRSDLARAVGKSPSLVAEWTGKGRGNLMAEAKWAEVESAARASAEGRTCEGYGPDPGAAELAAERDGDRLN